jgi:putative membrane protein
VMVPMILITVYHAIKDNREKHRRIARWTFPIWMYVSVTGVIIYLMVYQLFKV